MTDPIMVVPVDVTFLRRPAALPIGPATFPAGVQVVRVRRCAVPFYRFLYDTVGREWLWWMRRTLSDAQLAHLLAEPAVSIHVLYAAGQPVGFYELERRGAATNIAYFGLMPFAIGQGVGRALLRHALGVACAERGVEAVTVNTSTADHRRAMPTYLQAGFVVERTVRENWRIPRALGLGIPPHLPR